MPGALIGERYRIVALLGRGGMGEVYRADDLELGQSVALKFLPEKLAAEPVALNRLRGEVRTAREIAHPNVCRVYDIAQADGHVFLSMEYVDGEDLSHVLRRLGPPSRDKALEIARQLCLGLAAAHEKKVLHRDLKPANVMLDGRGHVRITDFGLAGFAEELEVEPQRAGTPAYMAPEQFESGTVSVRSDIYSLGLVLYELFTGKPAFSGGRLARSHASGSVPSLSSQNESVDPAVERVVQRCLEPDPVDRPPSVYSVLAGLPGGDPLVAALGAGETPSPEMIASVQERGGLSPSKALSLFLGVLIMLALGAVMQTRWSIAPEKGPDELGARAREMLRDLGHELPSNQAWDLDWNWPYIALLGSERGSRGWRHDGQTWPPPYLYWLRASPVSLRSDNIHLPVPALDKPLAAPPGSTTIVLGSGGRLVELEVVPEPALQEPVTRREAHDWSLVLDLAGLDRDDVELTVPARAVPAWCDEEAAFQVRRPEASGGDYVFQACAHQGRVVYAATVWEWDPLGPLASARQLDSYETGGDPLSWILTVVIILSALLAWYNVRLGRGDRQGAILYGVVVFMAYLLYNAFHARISEGSIGSFLSYVLRWDPFAHAAMHAIHTTLLYLAIEPYVRRVWPRALIGWARLARGRWRDPAVAKEVLIGMVVLLLLFNLWFAGWNIARILADRPVNQLLLGERYLGDSTALIAEIPHAVALSMLYVIFSYFVILVIRLVTRREWATIALLLSLPGLLIIINLVQGEMDRLGFLTLVFAATASMVLLLMRVGLLAAMVFLLVGILSFRIPLTFDMARFYAPQAIIGMLLLMTIAAYGFRYSLAGQPLLRKVLGDADAEGTGKGP